MNPILFVSLRATGDDPTKADLLEIAAARCEPDTANPTDVFTVPVQTSTAGLSTPPDAQWLVEVMSRLREMGKDCELAAWNGAGTRHFLEGLCERWELQPLTLAPQTLDMRPLSWPFARGAGAKTDSQVDVAKALGVDVNSPSCPLEDIRQLADLYRRVYQRSQQYDKLAGLSEEDRNLLNHIAERLGAPSGQSFVQKQLAGLAERASKTFQHIKETITRKLMHLAAGLLAGDSK